jgi:hypothetical protein
VRRIVLLLLVVAIGGGLFAISKFARKAEPLIIEVERFPKGTRELDVGEQSTRDRAVIYNLTIESRTEKTVNLKVRVEEGATPGIGARIGLNKPIRPASRELVRLAIGTPGRVGSFHATITLYSDELPGWSHSYKFKGSAIEKPLPGNYMEVRPPSIDLGVVRVGDQREFTVTLVNIGDAPVEIKDVRIPPGSDIEITTALAGATLGPGATMKVEGRVRIAGQGERFAATFSIVSDAVNAKVRRVRLFGVIGRDYDISPATMPVKSAYPSRNREYTVKISAAEGVAPFRVGKLTGLEPLFELAKPLSEEIAAKHSITLRLKRDAPTDVRPLEGAVRIPIQPAGVTLEWPYRIRVLPAIYAQPAEVNFGKVAQGALDKDRDVEVQIVALPGREFTVKAASAQQKRFRARVMPHNSAMPWQVVVTLPANSPTGIYRDQIVIELDDPEVKRIVVPVRAAVVR